MKASQAPLNALSKMKRKTPAAMNR